MLPNFSFFLFVVNVNLETFTTIETKMKIFQSHKRENTGILKQRDVMCVIELWKKAQRRKCKHFVEQHFGIKKKKERKKGSQSQHKEEERK